MQRFLGIDLAWTGATAATAKNETGVVALDANGAVLDAGWCVGIHAVHEWVLSWSVDDTLAFIDAPLMVHNTSGQRRCETAVGQRYGKYLVSANSTNQASPRMAGVALAAQLESSGWRYDSGLDGPPNGGRMFSECYPYATIVGADELGYEQRPMYKRKPKAMRVAEFRPLRAAACDDLVSRLEERLHDPPLRLGSHPVTAQLLDEPSPVDGDREYKHREDLLDAAICAWTALLWVRHGRKRCAVFGAREQDEAASRIATIIAPVRS